MLEYKNPKVHVHSIKHTAMNIFSFFFGVLRRLTETHDEEFEGTRNG